MKREDVERERPDDDSGTTQGASGPEGSGRDDSVPSSRDGVGIGAGTEANTFEPEEDPDAVDDGESEAKS